MRLSTSRSRASSWLLVFLIAGCDSDPTGGLAPGDITFKIVSGDEQEGEAGQELPRPLIAWITNPQGKNVKDVVVTFHVVSGGGSVFSGAAKSNEHGLVYEYWTLGTSTAAAQKLEVRAVDPATGQKRVYATFTATAQAGAPASITRHSGVGAGAGHVGSPASVSPAVLVRDRYGNPVPGATVTFEATDGGSVEHPSATADAEGIATAGAWILGPEPGIHRVLASIADLEPVTFAAEATIPPLGPASIQMSEVEPTFGDPHVIAGEQPVAGTALVRDAIGRPVEGVHVEFYDDLDRLLDTDVTNEDGIAELWWVPRRPGTWTVTAYLRDDRSIFSSSPNQVIVRVGAPRRVVHAPLEGTPYRVRVEDEEENGVPGIPVIFAEYGSSTLEPRIRIVAEVTTDADGHASIPSWTPADAAHVLAATIPDRDWVAPCWPSGGYCIAD